jgi:uncharacterized protein YraI
MLRTAFALICGTLIFGGIAAAQEETTTTFPATAYGTVNVRSGPGVQYDIVGQLAAGDEVMVDGRDKRSSGWLRVQPKRGTSGWVAGFTLMLAGSATALTAIEVPPAPAKSGNIGVVVIAYGRVNLRSGPGLDYTIIEQFDVGDEAKASGRGDMSNNWLYVERDNQRGWLAYYTVSVYGNPDTLPILKVDSAGQLVNPPQTVTKALYHVRLRAEAGPDAAEVGIAPFEAKVTALGRTDGADWVYVAYRDVSGWGLARLFDITPEQIKALPIYAQSPSPEATPEATAAK